MTRLLLVAAALVAVLAAAGVGAGAEWDVYPGEGTPIQAAIDGAGEGDTIYVHAGTYVENVDVDKRVTLIGDGADVATVRAADASCPAFEVQWVDYVNISGFAVTGATERLWCGWSGNNAGIYLRYANHCNISGNNASNNRCGILMDYSSDNTLQNNAMSGNTYNFGVGSYTLSKYTQNIDPSNTVDGKPIYYWVDQQDKQIPGDAGFVGVVNSTNITVKDLTLTKNPWRHVRLVKS